MMKSLILIKTFSCALILITVFSCSLGNHRLAVIKVLHNLRDIRTAQLKYAQQHDKFGSLAELSHEHLIAEELEGGVGGGCLYNTEINDSKYSVSVVSANNDSSNSIYPSSFYLDESGVIRASSQANVVASSSSEAIKMQ